VAANSSAEALGAKGNAEIKRHLKACNSGVALGLGTFAALASARQQNLREEDLVVQAGARNIGQQAVFPNMGALGQLSSI